MKRNALTLVVGVILLIIFFLLLFTFQVRQTEVVVLTTFDKPSSKPITEPGLYFKWPRPIQRVYEFDKRVHSFEDDFEQMLTRDNHNILASVYVGWTIEDPLAFFNSFPAGTPAAAQPALKSLVRSTKQAVIGQHSFSDFVSSDPAQVKFPQIEQLILQNIRTAALNKYGIEVQFVGIKKLGLPESVTQKVFDRMTAERQRQIESIRSQGEKEAMEIRSAAERDRQEILARAEAQATTIKGDAERAATEHFAVFNQNPELAVFLLKLKALQSTLNERSTLVVDERTAPFDLLKSAPTVPPTQTPPSQQQQTNGKQPQPALSQNAQNVGKN